MIQLIRAPDIRRLDVIATGPASMGTVSHVTSVGSCGRLSIVLFDGGRIEAFPGDKVAKLEVS